MKARLWNGTALENRNYSRISSVGVKARLWNGTAAEN
jgi:hypothetical protein